MTACGYIHVYVVATCTVHVRTMHCACTMHCAFTMHATVYVYCVPTFTSALMPHLEAVNFDLQRFIGVFHSIGGIALVMFYLLLADGCAHMHMCMHMLYTDIHVHESDKQHQFVMTYIHVYMYV